MVLGRTSCFFFIGWLGVSTKYLYFRLNHHVFFVLYSSLIFLVGGFLKFGL